MSGVDLHTKCCTLHQSFSLRAADLICDDLHEYCVTLRLWLSSDSFFNLHEQKFSVSVCRKMRRGNSHARLVGRLAGSVLTFFRVPSEFYALKTMNLAKMVSNRAMK